MRHIMVLVVAAFVFLGTSSVAMAQQSKAPCVDCYNPNTPKPWDNTQVVRDRTGQASVHRDAILADYGLSLSVTVNLLNAKCGPGAKPGDCSGAVEEAGKQAKKPAPSDGLTKKQRAQVKAMMAERDRAIIAAGSGDQAGLAAASRNLQTQVDAIKADVEVVKTDIVGLKAKDAEQDGRITALENGGVAQAGPVSPAESFSSAYRLTQVEAQQRQTTTEVQDLKTRIDNLQASPATDTASDTKLQELSTEIGNTVGAIDNRVTAQVAELEKLVARVEALEAKNAGAELSAEDRAALDQIKAKADSTLADISEALKTAKKAEAKADQALATAEKALALAQTKMDAGLLELGLEGFFSPAIKGIMVEGAYVITKGPFRVALGGALGLALDNGREFEFDTRIRAYYVVHKYVWLGLFGSMYGVGLPFNDEIGYGGGAIARFTTPLGQDSAWSWGVEGWIGPAYEYGWKTIGPPEGAAPGSVYDDQALEGKLVPMGGVTLVFTR